MKLTRFTKIKSGSVPVCFLRVGRNVVIINWAENKQKEIVIKSVKKSGDGRQNKMSNK